MKKFICLILVIFIFLPVLLFAEYIEEIRLYMGQLKIVPISVPEKIIISNPNIVDVTEVTEESLTLEPKQAGVTNFVVLDSLGEQSFLVRVLQEDITDIKMRVDNLIEALDLPDVYTRAAETESKVLLLGSVTNAEDKARINTALGELAEKTVDLIEVREEMAMVDIEVQVLELQKGVDRDLGLQWPSAVTVTEPTWRWNTLQGIPDAFYRITQWSHTAFTATLKFLEQEGKARILSQPRLTCQSGKEAKLLVGGEKPLLTTSVTEGGGETQEVEYKEYGIQLSIKPTVTKDKRIQLALDVEVSEVGDQVTIGGTTTTALAYPLTTRSATTEVYLNSGQTMVIGGLIKQKEEETIYKFPFLGDIPILGLLFRRKTTTLGEGATTKSDKELFVTLTPTIIEVPKQVKEVTPSSVSKKITALPVETKPLTAKESMPAELKEYIKTVQLKIVNAVYYPPEAKELGWQGRVGLMLRLASNGELKEAKILQSSGYKVLDEAALDIVQKQTPYPAFPAQVKLEELRIQIPIVYQKD